MNNTWEIINYNLWQAVLLVKQAEQEIEKLQKQMEVNYDTQQ